MISRRSFLIGLGSIVMHGRELAVDGLLEHHVSDDLRFGNAELTRLLRDLLLDQLRTKPGQITLVRTP
jgi:hypothetical protein